MEGTDRETFTPCDMCKKHQQMGHISLNTLCKGCRHNRTAIAWLRQQLATMHKTATALVFTVPGQAPVEAIPRPTVRLKPSACPHTTARFDNTHGFVCMACNGTGLPNDKVLYEPLFTRVPRDQLTKEV
jgi:hypothetical protein